jgi:hypothetical protein
VAAAAATAGELGPGLAMPVAGARAVAEASRRRLAHLLAGDGFLIDEFEAAPGAAAGLVALRPGAGGGRSLGVLAWTGGVLADGAAFTRLAVLGRALARSGLVLAGDLLLQALPGDAPADELAAVAERGYRADGTLVVSAQAGPITVGHAGHAGLGVTVYGKPAPAAREWFGISAVTKMLALMAGIGSRLPVGVQGPVPTAVRGGEWMGNVPNRCDARFHVTFDAPLSLGAARGAVAAALREIAEGDDWLRQRPPEVRWDGLAVEPVAGEADGPLAAALGRAFADACGADVTASRSPACLFLGQVPAGEAVATSLAVGTSGAEGPAATDARVLASVAADWCGRAGG